MYIFEAHYENMDTNEKIKKEKGGNHNEKKY